MNTKYDSTRVKLATRKSRHAGKFAKLVFDDGTVLDGSGFGRPCTAFGEIVFNTGMVGYTETLTDPSYSGQILTLTYPLVGNYGVPKREMDKHGIPKHFESDRIQPRGLVVHQLSGTASHWNLERTLDEWLYDEGIPGISGIDTRRLAKKLRTAGVQMAAIAVSDEPIDEEKTAADLRGAPSYVSEEFVDAVSTKSAAEYGSGAGPVAVIDAGAKNAIIRNICSMGYRAVRLPWNATIEKIMSYNPSGVVISNGPGDPQSCPDTIETARRLIERNVPTLGICLGAQIIGLAGNARTYKLKYGHRGQNKPCMNMESGQVYVTSQNHGYGIDPDSLKDSEFDMWFKNADDGTVEGIRHKEKNCVAVQFHPEASPGPYDCRYVFDELKRLMEEEASAKE